MGYLRCRVLATEISAKEAAVLTAALIAYLSKPKPIGQIETVERISAQVAEKEKVTITLKEILLPLEEKIKELIEEIKTLKTKVERLEVGTLKTREIKAVKRRPLWISVARHEACNRVIMKNVECSCHWRLTGKLDDFSNSFKGE